MALNRNSNLYQRTLNVKQQNGIDSHQLMNTILDCAKGIGGSTITYKNESIEHVTSFFSNL